MLEMQNGQNRRELEKYFYGANKIGAILNLGMILGLIIAAISGYDKTTGLMIFGICLVIKIILMIKGMTGAETVYDRILQEDILYLKERAVGVMGLIEEEYSLIDPIVANGYATDDSVKFGIEIEGEKDRQGLFTRIFNALKSLLTAIFRFIASLFISGTTISKSIFVEGTDKKVRSSLVSVVQICFTEQQIVSYTCNYDIALGIILEEYITEVFYRDVDSVNYGDETLHILADEGKKLIRATVSRVRFAVPSGKDIVASVLGETGLLENQVTAAKALVRSKKEEMS
ncbi:MAG: hypothetical protein IKZ43_06295 [Acidaminococcaceae bacterium]|nr:hypothetical protein [Acidaminococcaceae bacterium]